jgi:hypothetical protein
VDLVADHHQTRDEQEKDHGGDDVQAHRLGDAQLRRGVVPVVTREGEQDTMTLHAETGSIDASLADQVAATLQSVTKLKGAVKLVRPDSLPNDGKVIADERPIS